MSLARIEIEQMERDRWHAEVEIGGLVAQRRAINAASFDEVMTAILDAYHAMLPAHIAPAIPKQIIAPAALPQPVIARADPAQPLRHASRPQHRR